MSISAYVGLPRAGKSHGVVKDVILKALAEGRRVVHNVALNEAEIRKKVATGELVEIPKGQNAADFVAYFREHHAGALLVLDEAWRYWASGTKASAIPEAQKEFVAMHGHMTGQTSDGRVTDIVLITQSLSQLARFIVDLVEQTFHYQKLSFVGANNRFRCDVYSGPVTGPKPPVSKRLASFQGKYDPEIFKCYQTHTLSTTGGTGQEIKTDQRGNLLKSWKFKIAVGCLIAAPFVGVYAYHAFFALGKSKKPIQASGQQLVPQQIQPKPSKPAKPAMPEESKRWRIAGLLQVNGVDRVILQSSSGVRYLKKSACLDDAAGNRSCVLDGEIVTEWSGNYHADNVISSFVTAAATPDSLSSANGAAH